MKETLEEAAEKYINMFNGAPTEVELFIEGAKWMQEQMYSEGDMIDFVEYVALYPDKNRNHKNEMLHAKSKYDGAERTIDLLEIWVKEFK
jgi:hypothetical protein